MDDKEISDTENETEYSLVEDPLNMHRIPSNKITLISEIPNIRQEIINIIALR